jgi:hypothetical protein
MKKRWRYLLAISAVVIGVTVIVALWLFQSGHTDVRTQHTTAQKTASAIPGNERQIVQTYNQALLKQDWATVYASTSNIVVGDYTQEQFAQMMARQVQNVGVVSSITTTSNPEVKTNPDGIIYFTIHEHAIVVKNGTSQTQSLISLFILENGAWKFWFSKKV